jgi:signal transduction histidine kinase
VVEWVVAAPVVAPGDESKPVRAQIDRALIGVSTTTWRGTKERDTAILSAAQPIFAGDEIVGAVVVEETTGAIQLLKASALENLVAMTLLVSFGAFTILFLFASRLATRIRRLARDAETAIDAQGRFRGALPGSLARDEIGDLSRAFSAVLGRLKDYNATLEAMAGRLSHELRTPVAVVRSSLDNLKHEPMGDAAKTYLARAEEGTQRLSTLISRLSEATRLERMLESAERERFDLARVVSGCVEGYRAAFPSRAIALQVPEGPVAMTGVPDAIAQLLDKLVDNANDFATEGTPLRVALAVEAGRAVLTVANDGPSLPAGLVEGLFDAMVSVRSGSVGAHLGLGLTIARLVATAHGGEIAVRDIPGGVEVKVILGVRDVILG